MPAPQNLPVRRARVGGSFAPPIDQARLEAYALLAEDASPQVKTAMRRLVAMVGAWLVAPASSAPGRPHPSGTGMIVDLAETEIRRLWDLVPWLNAKQRVESGEVGDDDCEQYAALFETIPHPAEKDLRNAAHHLLWYACELALDREPITNDKL